MSPGWLPKRHRRPKDALRLAVAAAAIAGVVSTIMVVLLVVAVVKIPDAIDRGVRSRVSISGRVCDVLNANADTIVILQHVVRRNAHDLSQEEKDRLGQAPRHMGNCHRLSARIKKDAKVQVTP